MASSTLGIAAHEHAETGAADRHEIPNMTTVIIIIQANGKLVGARFNEYPSRIIAYDNLYVE
ncbi:hypothetical protein M5W98_14655 [Paenibacillus apiarius]|nr:hypothetical protein [Paenibacillus apiarius]